MDYRGEKVIAFYIPPIIESHYGLDVIIDGIHRSRICSSAGTTINIVRIRDGNIELPFKPITWSECEIVKEKPPIDERYHNLRKELFRDLSYVGIDG